MKQSLLLILFFLYAVHANCTTHWVTNTNNTGAGSLRAAAGSTFNTVGDTIRIDHNLLNSTNTTIVLSSPIRLGRVVLIGAYNATDTIYISGGGTTRVFNIQDYHLSFSYTIPLPAQHIHTTVLDSIYIKDGYANNSSNTNPVHNDGGAIFWEGYTNTYIPPNDHPPLQELIIRNSVFKNNIATLAGGAISVSTSGSYTTAHILNKHLIVNNTVFEGNQTNNSGAVIYAQSSVGSGNGAVNRSFQCTIDRCSFFNNRVGSSSHHAAALYWSCYGSNTNINSQGRTSQSVGITNSSFYNNNGSDDIYISTQYSQNSLSIRTSTIEGEIVCNTNSSYSSNLNIYNSTITDVVDFDDHHSTVPTYWSFRHSCNVESTILYALIKNNSTTLNSSNSLISTSLPALGPLQDNGGGTFTRMPMLGTNAINTGNPSDFSDAQNRSITDSRRDIGAAEYDCSSVSVLTQAICLGDTFYLGSQLLTIAGVYTDTFTNIGGCDSIVILDLAINNATTSTDVQVACGSYTWIDGNSYASNNNTATHTLTNAAGCDSVVTLNLTINNSTTRTDIQTACNSYTWIDGNSYASNNNTATYTLTNAAGCDSVVTLNLTINNSTTGTDIQTACNSYTWIDGNVYTLNNNVATHTLTNVAGCDSVITLDLTIHTIDTIVTQSGVTLMANQTVGVYQWIDCNNGNAPIAGATAQSFTALANGDYAVIITVNNCIDTSSCFNVVVSSIPTTMDEKTVRVYPNPTIGQVTIEFEEVIKNGKARLVDVNGRLLLETVLDGQQTIQWNINEFPTAVYFLELQTSKGIYKKKIIKE
jgi:hypothetical protein